VPLRFTLFDLVLYRRGQVGQAWAPYGSQSRRFLGLTFLIGFALLLLLAVTAGPLVLHLGATVRHLTQQQIDANPALIFAHVLPMYGIFFLLIIAAGVLSTVAGDFILPPMALEDAPLEASFARFFQLLRTRFWYVALYMLIRFALQLGIGWIGMMIVFIVLLILSGGGFGVGFVLYRAFWHAGSVGVAVFICFCVVAGLLLIAAYLLMILALYGAIAIVKQSYAVYFYGSYYPQLGDRLDPPGPVPSSQVPPISSLEPFPPPIPSPQTLT
jgi:hypothetical protein